MNVKQLQHSSFRLHRYCTATRPGFEPGQREPKSLVLPLHYRVRNSFWSHKRWTMEIQVSEADPSDDEIGGNVLRSRNGLHPEARSGSNREFRCVSPTFPGHKPGPLGKCPFNGVAGESYGAIRTCQA